MTKNTKTNLEAVAKRLVDLYYVQTQKYLVQNKNGNYVTIDTKRKADTQRKVPPVCDWQLINHLKFKHTLGAYGGVFKNKLICFDVDFHEHEMAKWITYKITDTLDRLGIEHYYISFSGSKGYHIELFFEDLISLDNAKKFFDYVILKSEVLEHSNESNKVEFRVTDRQGIKIPLGIHQKTKQFCGFCKVEDGLKVMDMDTSYLYLLEIKKIKEQQIRDIIGMENVPEKADHAKSLQMEEALAHYNELDIYNPSEDDAISRAIDLINNGLKHRGSRHNSLLIMAKYFLYSGLEEDDCKLALYEWMKDQDSSTYTTKLQDCFKDIDLIVRYTYERNYQIKPREKFIEVTYEEMLYILDYCKETSQILLSYAFLVHGRIFARKDGVFYFPFSLMQKATGLSEKTCRNQVNYIESMGVINIVTRNEKQDKGYLKKANRYKLSLAMEEQVTTSYKVDFKTSTAATLNYFFTEKELKFKLGKKRYKSLIGL